MSGSPGARRPRSMGQAEMDDGVFVVVWKDGRARWALSRGLLCYWFVEQIRQSGCGHSSRSPSTSKVGSDPIKASLPPLIELKLLAKVETQVRKVKKGG